MSGVDDSACQRWGELSDRKLIDEQLSDEDAAFLDSHRKSCPLCRAEAEAWSSLGALPEEPSLAGDAADALVTRALALAAAARDADETEAKKLPLRQDDAEAKKLPLRQDDAEAKKLPLRQDDAEAKKLPLRAVQTKVAPETASVALLEAPRVRGNVIILGIAAALAVAAAVALFLRGSVLSSGPQGSRGPAAKLIELSGDVRVGKRAAQLGDSVPAGAHLSVGAGGHACITFDGGSIKSCLGPSTDLALTTTTPTDRQLSLAQGSVVTALDKLPEGHQFTVAAEKGRATVTGTVFSVTAAIDSGSLVVRVHEGSVKVRGGPKDGSSVTEGHELDVVAGVESDVAAGVRTAELELVGVSLPRHAQLAPTPSASVALSEPDLPTTALPSAVPETLPKPPSASEMLASARTFRAQGNASGAADAYRRLMAVHPKSAEARAALLSLAELQLGPLGDPSGALRSYDSYLRSGGGGLSQEASYGRIQALRRLGRAAEERAAVDAFVKAYPNSVQARALKNRADSDSGAP